MRWGIVLPITDPPNNCMIGCSIEDTLVDKLFQDQTTPLLTPPLLLPVVLPNHDLYLFRHVYLEPLPFASECQQLSLKHVDVNGDRNSLKKNSWKNYLKVLEKSPSSSSGLALKIESMIQLPSRGVMLRFFPFHTLDTRLTYLCQSSPSYLFHNTLPLSFIHVSYAALHYFLSFLILVSLMHCLPPLDTCTPLFTQPQPISYINYCSSRIVL